MVTPATYRSNTLSALYADLGQLIAQGTDAFLTGAPAVLSEIASHPRLHPLCLQPIERLERIKIMGEPGAHVLLLIKWPAGIAILPHGHNGNPGIDYVVSGSQVITDWKATVWRDGKYRLTDLQYRTLTPGQHAVVDPRVTEIHSVRAPVPTRSLHVYPVDYQETFVYVPKGKRFHRERMRLEQQVPPVER